MQRTSLHGQDFPLRTVVAGQDYDHFTSFIVHLCHEPQLIRPAHQTFHMELAERTVCRCLGRLIIFTALKPACGVHSHTLTRHMDICGPSRGFWLLTPAPLQHLAFSLQPFRIAPPAFESFPAARDPARLKLAASSRPATDHTGPASR